MATTIKEERLRWVLPIVKKEIKLVDVAKVCPHGKRSLERWVAAYNVYGEKALVPRSTRPKTQPNETPIAVKEKVIALRKKTKLCAQKLAWKLEKEGIHLHRNTIHKFVHTEGLTRRYRVKKIKTKYVKIPLSPGELFEIDVKFVPKTIKDKAYFQYTAKE